MKTLLSTLLLGLICLMTIGQDTMLPRGFSQEELLQIAHGDFQIAHNDRGIAAPPAFSSIRAMAEWEELQALTISWTSYPSILKQIVAAAQSQTRVIILTDDPAATEAYLLATNEGGPALASMNGITLLNGPYDSIWMRDYAGNPVYANDVDSLALVDWIYNRPTRPNDDASPQLIADELGIDLYTITDAPTDLVNTGGNWMSDGFGTAFASKLVLDENNANNPYGVTTKSEADINQIAQDFLGINRYIKMETLPYDQIHHIDMHMKLIDEETLVVGEYPDGIADGPQINANIEYVLSNFNSKWGTPYKVIRMPQPPSASGGWPSSANPASYRTYTNMVFVNNSIIFPTYREEYDTTAFRIYGDALPGYNLIGIDCDNSSANIISLSGAIHCITHSVGVADPLLISHQSLQDTDNTIDPYAVVAFMKHRSGVASGQLFYKTSLNGSYSEVEMTSIGNDNWQGFIPAQTAGTRVYYYVKGTSNTGKVQVRPMPAPAGYWSFDVLGTSNIDARVAAAMFSPVFPNPANAITCIPMNFDVAMNGQLKVVDMLGNEVALIYDGSFAPGEKKFFLDASKLSSGTYQIVLQTNKSLINQALVVIQ